MQDVLLISYFEGKPNWEKGETIPFLTEEDLQNAERYVFEQDKLAHLVSAYFKRKYVGAWEISESGKPVKDGEHFNASHCEDVVVFVRADEAVGIDVEKIKPMEDAVKRYVCSDEEYAFLHSDKDFFSIWTAKESLVKAQGKGLNVHPKRIPAFPLVGEKAYEGEEYYVNEVEINDAVISVARKGKEPFTVKIIKENI